MRRAILWSLPFLIVLGLFSFPGRTSAQSQTKRFETLTIEDGLSQNAVLTIAQDVQGFLWLGTEDGLNKYDGYQFTVHKHDSEDATSLADNFISVLYLDRTGELWVGTRSGLDRYDRTTGRFVHYPVESEGLNGLMGAWILSLYEDQEGTLWIGTQGGGLFSLDRETDEFNQFQMEVQDPASASDASIRVIFEDSSANLWVGTQGGLHLLDRGSGTLTTFSEGLISRSELLKNISVIMEDRHGNIWIGTEENGAVRYDPKTKNIVVLRNRPDNKKSLSHDRVRSIYESSDGNLWIGTQNGLNLLPSDLTDAAYLDLDFQHFYHDPYDPSSIGSSAVWSIFEDRSGILWFGTWGGGLSKYNRATDRFKLYQHNPANPDTLSDNMVWSILEDSSGRLWIGTLNGGLDMLNRDTNEIVHFRHEEGSLDSILSDDVRALYEDEKGSIWIGTAGGLSMYDPENYSFRHFKHDPEDQASLSGDRVNMLEPSSDGKLWVGTRYDGLNLFDPRSGESVRYRHDPDNPSSLGDDRIWALYEDSHGALWVGTLDGISVLRPGAEDFIRFHHDPENPSSLGSNSIFAFFEDPSGSMWVGTWGGGLDRYDHETGKFEHFTEEDGLPNDTIYGIQADDQGNLWMSTNRGLATLDLSTLQFQDFDKQDGLQDHEFNVGAHHKSPSGELYFGGIGGFNAFYPAEIVKNPHVPPIVITAFYKFNEPLLKDLDQDQYIELDHQDDFIAFEFAALDFYSPKNNQYAYMLEGFDEEWVEAGSRRYVSYTNLDGGDYIFRVRGSNSDGVWNEAGAAVALRIQPPVWEMPVFQIGIILVLAVAALGIYRYRIHAVETRSLELERVVQQRTAEIEARRQELDALYRADGELIRNLEAEQVFKAIVNIAVDILAVESGMLAYRDQESGAFVVRATQGLDPQAQELLTSSLKETDISWILESESPVVIQDVSTDPRVKTQLLTNLGIQASMHAQIRGEETIYGLLSVGNGEPRSFGTEEQRLFAALAQRAAIAIEQTQLQDQAQKTAVYEERQRLARDLHDAVTQTLFSASLISEILPKLWEIDEEAGRDRLKVLNELTRGALAEMRMLLLELRPSAIEQADLDDLLEQLVNSTIGRARIPIDLTIEGECQLPADVKVELYRIAQEALNNVVKHSEASSAEIHATCAEKVIELRIRDNGVGFDPGAITPERLGLGIMHERAVRIGASFELITGPEIGTEIIIRAPYEHGS